jgi:hypothetical protein
MNDEAKLGSKEAQQGMLCRARDLGISSGLLNVHLEVCELKEGSNDASTREINIAEEL